MSQYNVTHMAIGLWSSLAPQQMAEAGTAAINTDIPATNNQTDFDSWSTTMSAATEIIMDGGQMIDEQEMGPVDSNDLINNDFVQIFFGILYTTVFVLGVFGNVLVCYVVLRNRAMQTVTNIFITNLALSDILLCVLAVPFTPLYTFMGRWAFGRTLCHLVSFAQGCSIYISTLTLTSIAIDRYFVIIYPFHPRMKLSTCIAIIVSIWVVALLATLPYGMYVKVVSEELLSNATIPITGEIMSMTTTTTATTTLPSAKSTSENARRFYDKASTTIASITTTLTSTSSETTTPTYRQVMTTTSTGTSSTTPVSASASFSYCEENWPSEHYRKVFGSVTTIVQFVLPFIVISICYIWISVKLNARARAKPGSKSSRREEADRDRKKRTNRMLIAMVGVFGLSWLPINMVNIFDDFYEKSNEWRYYTLFFFVAHSIAMSSTCYNPFLYAWLNENFRKEFKHVLPCFNPSNNNLIGITRGYNRSERNTCGPRLHRGARGDGEAGEEGEDENGMTQETSLHVNARDKLLIIPREATYGNGAGGMVAALQATGKVPISGGGIVGPNATTPIAGATINGGGSSGGVSNDIALNESDRRRCRRDTIQEFDIDSGDEQTVEVRFCETPFGGAPVIDATTTSALLNNNNNNSGGSGMATISGGSLPPDQQRLYN